MSDHNGVRRSSERNINRSAPRNVAVRLALGALACCFMLAACGGGGSAGGGAPATYMLGGSVSGLTASGLILTDSGGASVAVSANATSFQFPSPINSGTAYSVTVQTQPAGETCTVANGTGTITANVTSVSVSCTAAKYSIGGSISGLSASGLVLLDNGGDALSVPPAATSFQFATSLVAGSAYSVTVQTQPAGESCSVAAGSGTVGSANVTNVAVSCSAAVGSYSVGGTVTGMAGSGLVLQDNAGDNLPVAANGTFTFPTKLTTGQSYQVTVMTQPATPAQHCIVTSASGTVGTANVGNVQVTCRNFGQFVLVTTTFGGTDGVITLFSIDPATGLVSRETRDDVPSAAQPAGIQFDQSGYAYIAYQDGSVVGIGTLSSGPTFNEVGTVNNGAGTITESVAVDPKAAFVYAGGNNGAGALFAYASGMGALTPLSTPTYGTAGTAFSLAIDPAGKFLFAPTGSAGTIDSFAIAADGSLTALTPLPFQGGAPANTPYAVAVSPVGNFLYITDNTANTVTGYTYDANTGALTQIGSPQPVGNDPQSVTVDPSGQFLYIANSADGTVSGFTINQTTGGLTAIGGSPFNTNAGASTTPTAVQVEPSGAYAYVVNGSATTISSFSIDPLTGALTEIDAGGTPQSVIGGYPGYGSGSLTIE